MFQCVGLSVSSDDIMFHRRVKKAGSGNGKSRVKAWEKCRIKGTEEGKNSKNRQTAARNQEKTAEKGEKDEKMAQKRHETDEKATKKNL